MATNYVPLVRVIIRVLDKHCKRPRCDFRQMKQHFMRAFPNKKKKKETKTETKTKKYHFPIALQDH